MGSPLEEALAALDAGADDTALAAISEAWRRRRDPALAALADLVARRSPSALQQRLDHVVAPRVSATLERFAELTEVDDPLLATFVLDALERPPFVGASAEPLLAAFVATAERLRDPRLCERAGAIVRVWRHLLTPKPARLRLEAALRGAVEVAEKSCPPAPTAVEDRLTEALAARLRRVATLVRSTAELFADVYASPDDDGARLVLADRLLESSDPAEIVRGELIALQFHRRRGTADAAALAREEALLKHHGKAWLGPLAPVVGWGKGYNATRFERGFVSLADVNLSAGRKIRLVLEEPSWATVEELTGYYDFELLERAALPGLRRIERALDDDKLRRLAARASPLRLVEAEFHGPFDPALLRRALPHVEVISVHVDPPSAAVIGRLMKELDGPPIRRLVVNRRYSPKVSAEERAAFDALVEEIASLPITLPEVALQPPFAPPLPPPVELRSVDGRYRRQEGK